MKLNKKTILLFFLGSFFFMNNSFAKKIEVCSNCEVRSVKKAVDLAAEGDEIIIGTLPDAEYRVTGDPFVSRKHCVLQRTDGQIILKDNGSSNGTYLRVEKATSIPNGSVILVGKHLLRIEWE